VIDAACQRPNLPLMREEAGLNLALKLGGILLAWLLAGEPA
jgi:hypothetical protein